MGGDFLTQFFYYRFAGAAILTIVLLLLGDFTRRSFERCLCGRFSFVIALVVMTVEAIFYFRADFRLSSAAALIGSMGLFLLYCLICKEWIKWVVAVAFVILAYWMFGYGCFVFVLLVVLHAFFCTTAQFVGVVLLIVFALYNGYNKQKEEIMNYDFLIRSKQWDKVVQKAQKKSPNTPMSVADLNLALAKTGEMSDHMRPFYRMDSVRHTDESWFTSE